MVFLNLRVIVFTKNIKGIQLNRFYSVKPLVKLDETVSKNLENEVFKPRHHPGRIHIATVSVPEKAVKAILNVSEDYPVKKLLDDNEILTKRLLFRLPPVEEGELQEIKSNILTKILEKEKKPIPEDDEEQKQYHEKLKSKLYGKLRENVYNWYPVDFDVYTSIVYLYARFAPNYAVMAKIFYEINLRDPGFKPKSFFDFGSGVGTATWAANLYWKNSLFEYFNVDSSRDMNDLALMLLVGGRINSNSTNIKGTFFRQFLPANNISYDLVVCAYSLFELPSLKSRLQTIINLWNKTTGYLVIVEYGTKAGFKLINEVRDFILGLKKEKSQGHIFSPCPHDFICPIYLTDTKPCNFDVSYMTLPIGAASAVHKENYSYVVLKKGKRSPDDEQWPRLVKEPLVRSKHAICRMCCKNGKLEEIIFTSSKHGQPTYYCGKLSKRGDRLPIEIKNDT